MPDGTGQRESSVFPEVEMFRVVVNNGWFLISRLTQIYQIFSVAFYQCQFLGFAPAFDLLFPDFGL